MNLSACCLGLSVLHLLTSEELLQLGRGVLYEMRVEVYDEDEDVKRQPADPEQNHHHDQHLYHLQANDRPVCQLWEHSE